LITFLTTHFMISSSARFINTINKGLVVSRKHRMWVSEGAHTGSVMGLDGRNGRTCDVGKRRENGSCSHELSRVYPTSCPLLNVWRSFLLPPPHHIPATFRCLWLTHVIYPKYTGLTLAYPPLSARHTPSFSNQPPTVPSRKPPTTHSWPDSGFSLMEELTFKISRKDKYSISVFYYIPCSLLSSYTYFGVSVRLSVRLSVRPFALNFLLERATKL
jgi:hypothetical protein